MRKVSFVSLCFAVLAAVSFSACNKGETYAKMKEKERDAINRFLQSNHFVGPINVINEATFSAQGEMTRTERNEFVLFEDDGIYMQIVRKGAGQSMIEMAREQPDSTVTKTVCCRFFEYDIENADTTCANIYQKDNNIVDKMQVTYTRLGRSYTAYFTDGRMRERYYTSSVVPSGWLKPLDFIRLVKKEGAGDVAKVRLIIPHSSGTANAYTYVLPFYYEITYQLGN